MSKVIEHAVAAQLKGHLAETGLSETFQSAYCTGCSTETALLRVQNDVHLSIDKQKAVGLVLLDLSAAFDNIDHKILLERLEHRVGITGTVLQWFKSYLENSFQKLYVNSSESSPKPGFGTGPSSLCHIRFATWRHHQKASLIFSFLS